MLDLSDIRHLPELAQAVEQLVADGPGVALVAGLDPPVSSSSVGELPLPSGRGLLFRILTRRLLVQATRRVLIVTPSRETIRVTRDRRRRVDVVIASEPDEVAARLWAANGQPPDLVIVQPAAGATVIAAGLALAGQGAKVLAQLDTSYRGRGVVRELLAGGAKPEELAALTWIVASQRVPALCTTCAELRPPDPLALAELDHRFPGPHDLPAALRHARGCTVCGGTGYTGELFLFDVYRPAQQASAVTYESYALKLAAEGALALEDVLSLDALPLRQMHALRAASEQALRTSNADLQRKIAELESAHRVSAQRTEALVAVQRVSEVLLSDASPRGLAGRICREVRDLCGADRVVLYAVTGDQAAALGEAGWGVERLPLPLPIEEVCPPNLPGNPAAYSGWPPGIPARPADVEGAVLRAGMRVPLIAQGETVGAMYVHTTVRTSFAPGHVALLQTLSAHAALALQRAALTAELRAKVAALEAAQAELAVKARMARELELARQVQQSFLPRTFPQALGYAFDAYNEPAREVGGDFYDVIELGGGRVGLVVADVSDKGMAAALYMVLSRSLLRAEAVRETSPRRVLGNVNRLLLDLGEQGMFVSIFYGVLDTATQQLTYSRAGHDRPLLLRDGQAQPLGGRGMLLGVFDEAEDSLTEEQVYLQAGDRLALYTDGLTDLLNPAGDVLGYDRLCTMLVQHAALPAAVMCRRVADALGAYRAGAEQTDDMTLLIVAALGANDPATTPPATL